MKSTVKYFKLLIKNNTGISSKSFVMILSAITGTIFIFSMLFLLFVDMFSDRQINSDMFGIAAIITAIGTFIGTVFWAKVRSERNDSYVQTEQLKQETEQLKIDSKQGEEKEEIIDP